MDQSHAEAAAMMPSKTLFTISFASIGSGIWAAAELQQWPSIIISVTIGTIAFWFAAKNATEDRRYTTLMKRCGEMEEDYEKRILAYEQKMDHTEKRAEEAEKEYEAKTKELKDKLDAADDEIRTNRHNIRDLQQQAILQKALAEHEKCPFVASGSHPPDGQCGPGAPCVPIVAEKVEIKTADVKKA